MVKLLVSVLMLVAVSSGSFISKTVAGVDYKTYSFAPADADLGDLQHDYASSWGISPSLTSGEVITGATLQIKNLYNWVDNEWNSLYINLLDNAPLGVKTYRDLNLGGTSNSNLNYFDNWSGSHIVLDRLNWNYNLYEDRTAPITGADAKLIATGKNNLVTINFTGAELATLSSYISNGNSFGFGVDADCHFYNDGFKFTMNTEKRNDVPEPAILSLFGFGILGILALRRKK